MPTEIKQLRAMHREIVASIISRLSKTADTGSTKDWTDAVKETMHDLCKEYLSSCEYYAGTHRGADCPSRHREWLLDAIWWVGTKRNSSNGVLLGLESEWRDSPDEVISDFEKVLAMKTPIKIILFEESKKHPEAAHIKALNELCGGWSQHSRGDVLYAINFHGGRHDTFFYEADKDGAIPNFAFRKESKLSGPDDMASS